MSSGKRIQIKANVNSPIPKSYIFIMHVMSFLYLLSNNTNRYNHSSTRHVLNVECELAGKWINLSKRHSIFLSPFGASKGP